MVEGEKSKKYKKQIISISEKDRLMQKYADHLIFERKIDINGCCIRLWTDKKDLRDMWDENWFFMSENIRSHGRIIAISIGKKEPIVQFDPISKTVFFFDCDYYGWIKSAALALAGDILEDNHHYYSIHGALIDYDGKGISIIGPSGTGKTTISYGLLRYKNTKLVADDWHFFKFFDGSGRKDQETEIIGYTSEKNTYIRADLAATWPTYKNIFEISQIDKKGRAIVDITRIVGKGGVKKTTEIKGVVLLQREKKEEIVRKLTASEALRYIERNNYCNPHLLQHNSWKRKLRRRAFLKLFENVDVYLVNTIENPEETLDRICKLFGIKKELRELKI